MTPINTTGCQSDYQDMIITRIRDTISFLFVRGIEIGREGLEGKLNRHT
jgi:hypothetical protein